MQVEQTTSVDARKTSPTGPAGVRIGVDARILELPCPTGVERAARETIRAMASVLRAGTEVLVFTRRPLTLGIEGAGALRGVALEGPEAPAVWRETRLAPALADHGVQVLWSPVAALPLRTSIPRVATVHEVPWLVRPRMEGFLRERVHRLRLRVAAQVARRVVCPSRSAASQFSQVHPDASDRVRVVPHGVPEAFFATKDATRVSAVLARQDVETPYLLHVGGTRARKNTPLLLRAYARYLLRGGRASLVMVGPGDPPTNAPRRTRFLGYVADDALLALYDGASMLVVSSDSEGFALPVLEAMARGVPVVSTSAGGIAETAGGAARLVPAGDDDALAAALREVEIDARTRQKLVEKGLARAAQCRFTESAAKLLAVCEEAAR
jgi:glycosyltransferase involved in cell wall biosynthesis